MGLVLVTRRARVNAGPIVPTGTAALTGTVTASITDADIVAGGKTIILTLTNDTFVASGATFDAQRQAIINGLVSAQSEATGWNLVVKAGLAVTTVVRTSSTVCTITLSAFASYLVTASETITATIPGSALTLGNPIVAAPTFGVTFTPSAIWTGWTEFEDEPFDTITPAGWVSTAGGGTRSLVSSGTEMNYPPLMTAGTSPWTYERAYTPARGVGSSQKYLVSSDFIGNTITDKVSHFWGGIGTSSNRGIQSLQGSGSAALICGFRTQNTDSSSGGTVVVGTLTGGSGGAFTYEGGAVQFTRAAFHIVDTQCMGNTSGNADGWFKVFIDGTLVIHVTGYAWKTGGNYLWDEWFWDPTYGGNAEAVPSPGNFKERTGDGAGYGVKLYSKAA